MNSNKSIGFVNGDNRQIYMVSLFEKNNWKVFTYGLSIPRLSNMHNICDNLSDVIINCDILVFPFKINLIPYDIFTSSLPLLKGKTIFSGNITKNYEDILTQHNIIFYDFFKSEQIARLNAIATAEGCIKEAISLSPYNLHGAKSLVLGYGNCGCVLANKLLHLSSDVTVCCRNPYQKACAITEGLKCISLNDIHNYIFDYLYIFNTIPAPILNASLLEKANPNSTLIDIASLPGGLDLEYAKMNNLTAVNIPGIPGIVSPMSSARILYDYIIDVIS